MEAINKIGIAITIFVTGGIILCQPHAHAMQNTREISEITVECVNAPADACDTLKDAVHDRARKTQSDTNYILRMHYQEHLVRTGRNDVTYYDLLLELINIHSQKTVASIHQDKVQAVFPRNRRNAIRKAVRRLMDISAGH